MIGGVLQGRPLPSCDRGVLCGCDRGVVVVIGVILGGRSAASVMRLAGSRGKAKQGRLQGKTNSAEPRQSKPGSRAKSAGPKVGLLDHLCQKLDWP